MAVSLQHLRLIGITAWISTSALLFLLVFKNKFCAIGSSLHNTSLKYDEQLPKLTSSISWSDEKILRQHSFRLRHHNSTSGVTLLDRPTVIISVASHHVHGFVHNLHCFASQRTDKKIVLLALDKNISQIATKQGIPNILWNKDTPSESKINGYNETGQPLLFGSSGFNKLTMSKFEVVRQVLRLGLDVIFTDVDIIWCNDIPKRLAQLAVENPHFDSLMQSNFRAVDRKGDFNTGFYYMQSNPRTIQLYDIFCEKYLDDPKRDDQRMFWRFACHRGMWSDDGNGFSRTIREDGTTRYQCEWGNSSVRIMLLPLREFPNGASDPDGRALGDIPRGYYRQMCRNRNVSIWHVNFLKGFRKEHVLREQDAWISDGTSCQTI